MVYKRTKHKFRNLIKTPTLTDEESNSLEGHITKQEAHSALKQMKNDKSPGSDGYTTEFFSSFFFVDLGSLMVRSINHGFCKGKCQLHKDRG